jgi:hypothetical protein
MARSQFAAARIANRRRWFRTLDKTLTENFADLGAHPTMREHGVPAPAVSITAAGRAALRKFPGGGLCGF